MAVPRGTHGHFRISSFPRNFLEYFFCFPVYPGYGFPIPSVMSVYNPNTQLHTPLNDAVRFAFGIKRVRAEFIAPGRQKKKRRFNGKFQRFVPNVQHLNRRSMARFKKRRYMGRRRGPKYRRRYRRRRMAKMEVKHVERSVTAATAGAVATSIVPIALNNLAQGSGTLNRVGRHALSRSIRIRIIFNFPATEATQLIRIMLIKWNIAGGITQTLQQVLEDATKIQSFLHLDHMKAKFFNVLYDKTMSMDQFGTYDERRVYISKKLRSSIFFDSSASTTDLRGGLFIYIFTDATTNRALFDMETRYTFTDP